MVSFSDSPLVELLVAESEKPYHAASQPVHRGLEAEPRSGRGFKKEGGDYLSFQEVTIRLTF